MKKKDYLKPAMQVVKLKSQALLQTGSVTGGVNATMESTWVEEDI